ncbi:hypothetical protein M422DRAFT_256921, partial [Sphaerobolus stellatus SS14]
MVILTSDQDSDSKTPTSPTSTRFSTNYDSTVGSHTIASSSYPSSQPSQSARHYEELEAPPQYSPRSPQTPLLSPYFPTEREWRRPAHSRFFRTLFIAAIIYVIVASLTRGVYVSFRSELPISTLPGGMAAGPIGEDGHVINCFSGESINKTEIGSEPPYSTSVSFSIPSSSDLIYFLSRGDYGFGSLRFELSDKDKDDIEIEVTIKYHKREMWRRSQVCSLERDAGRSRGIAFF